MVHAATALAVPDKTTPLCCVHTCVCIPVCVPVCQAHTGLVGGVCVLWGRLDALDQGDDGTDALDDHERPLMPATRDSRDAQATRDAQGSCKRARKLVLVGHSTAGMHARLYCHRYPEEVSMSVAIPSQTKSNKSSPLLLAHGPRLALVWCGLACCARGCFCARGGRQCRYTAAAVQPARIRAGGGGAHRMLGPHKCFSCLSFLACLACL